MDQKHKRQAARHRPAALYWAIGLTLGIISGATVAWELTSPTTTSAWSKTAG